MVNVATFILVALIAGSLLIVTVRSYDSVSGAPKLVLQEKTKDLGIARPGAILSGEFRIYNNGQSPLTISNLNTSCGCLPAHLTRNDIPPNDSAFLSVDARLPMEPGLVSHTVFFETNDPKNPHVVLRLVAKGEWPIHVQPERLKVSSIPVKVERSYSLDVNKSPTADVTVIGVETSDSWIQLTQREHREGRLRFDVQIRPPHVGRFTGWIRFRTTDELRPNVIIPVEGSAEGHFSVQPNVLTLGQVQAGTEHTVSVKARFADKLLRVSRVVVVDEEWNVDWEEEAIEGRGADGGRLRIRLSIRAPFEQGFRRTNLVFHFCGGEYPIEVSVSALVTNRNG